MSFWIDHFVRHCGKPDVIVNGEGKPYLKRYSIIHHPWLRVYLHQILLSDDDRSCHDHPWKFTTLLLSGGYIEELPHPDDKAIWRHKKPIGKIELRTIKKFRPRFSIIWHEAKDFHRIDLPENKPVWTLFFAGKKKREWGFMTENGWVNWRSYLNEKFGPQSIEMDMAVKEME